jgi:hypothetical protein
MLFLTRRPNYIAMFLRRLVFCTISLIQETIDSYLLTTLSKSALSLILFLIEICLLITRKSVISSKQTVKSQWRNIFRKIRKSFKVQKNKKLSKIFFLEITYCFYCMFPIIQVLTLYLQLGHLELLSSQISIQF